MEVLIQHSNILIAIAVIIGFLMACGIGANDVANAMATSIGTKSLTVIQALIRLLSEETTDIAAGSNNPEFLSKISETVERAAEKAIERTLPSFLAGYMACAAGFNPLANEARLIPANTSAVEENDEDAADDIDFDFLGLS